MNIEDKDYKDFINAYNNLPIIFRVGKYNVRNLNHLSDNDVFDEILWELSESLSDSFYITQIDNNIEGQDYDFFASIRMELELYNGLSEVDRYIAAIYDIVEVNYPNFNSFYNSIDFFVSFYFYDIADEYNNAVLLLGKIPKMEEIKTTSKYSIKLSSGRDIYLEQLFQSYTYKGLLEGRPTKKINTYIILDCFKIANEKLSFDVEPVLIAPEEFRIGISKNKILSKKEFLATDAEQLADIVCLSSWNSYESAQDEQKFGSFLKIIWFQNKFALPIDDLIIEQIKSVDWNKYAVDYDL